MTYSNVIKLFITICVFILFSVSVLAAPPTHSTPILNSTLGDNDLDENLTVYNQSTSDPDGDPVKNIYSWFRNNTPIAILNLPFEGGSNATNTTDYSGKNRVVTINGTTITWNSSAGIDGKGAYDFNESFFSEKMRVTGLPTNGANGWSVVAWIKPRELDSNFHMIFGDCDNINFYFLITNANKLRVSYANATGQQKFFDTAVLPTANIWYHVALTVHPNSTVNLYINGSINASQTENQGISTTLLATQNIGNSETQCGQTAGVKFNGTIDEFAFYNMSLTPGQVRALYNNRTNVIDSSMLAGGDTWNASITPNDGNGDGITLFSNAVLIITRYILDRHAPENITGDWKFRGKINLSNVASLLGNVLVGDLLSRIANETVLGNWTFTRNLTLGAGLLVQNENDSLFRVLRAPIKFKDLLDRTANENVTGNWTFSGVMNITNDNSYISGTPIDQLSSSGWEFVTSDTVEGTVVTISGLSGANVFKVEFIANGTADENVSIRINGKTDDFYTYKEASSASWGAIRNMPSIPTLRLDGNRYRHFGSVIVTYNPGNQSVTFRNDVTPRSAMMIDGQYTAPAGSSLTSITLFSGSPMNISYVVYKHKYLN